MPIILSPQITPPGQTKTTFLLEDLSHWWRTIESKQFKPYAMSNKTQNLLRGKWSKLLQSHIELPNSSSLSESCISQSQHIFPFWNAKGWSAGHSANNGCPPSHDLSDSFTVLWTPITGDTKNKNEPLLNMTISHGELTCISNFNKNKNKNYNEQHLVCSMLKFLD